MRPIQTFLTGAPGASGASAARPVEMAFARASGGAVSLVGP